MRHPASDLAGRLVRTRRVAQSSSGRGRPSVGIGESPSASSRTGPPGARGEQSAVVAGHRGAPRPKSNACRPSGASTSPRSSLQSTTASATSTGRSLPEELREHGAARRLHRFTVERRWRRRTTRARPPPYRATAHRPRGLEVGVADPAGATASGRGTGVDPDGLPGDSRRQAVAVGGRDAGARASGARGRARRRPARARRAISELFRCIRREAAFRSRLRSSGRRTVS